MDDDALYVKIRIRKQIKNKKKLYRASLLTKDKKEKVIGWFVTRAEATNIANITRDRHEKIRLLRAEAMSTTNVNGNVQPKNDIIIINNEATRTCERYDGIDGKWTYLANCFYPCSRP